MADEVQNVEGAPEAAPTDGQAPRRGRGGGRDGGRGGRDGGRGRRDDRRPRDEDGGESHAPAFLKAPRAPRAPKAEAPAADGEEKPKARRRRAPRSFEGGETSNETEEA